ncbi:MAG TPA: sulfatase-like hydrolase/transferase [Acidimicrobiales bacterium]
MADDDDSAGGAPEAPRRNLRTWSASAVGLVGAAGLAVTQPVLDLFGRNPEFFVAGRYDSGQVVVFGLAVALVPAAVAVAGSTLAWLAHPRLGAVVLRGALAVFAFLFGLVLAGHLGIGAPWLATLAAALVATAVVWLHAARAGVRTLLSYLAVGNVAFLAMFLFASPAADLVDGASDADDVGGVTAPPLRGPVVVVILDEFPLATLLRADGTINDDRYPNFARLAASSTWFRNAASRVAMTSVAVPPILTGHLPGKGALPSYEDYPRNYFTVFGDRYPVNRYESVTDLCPPTICDPPPAGSLREALQDGAVVYGHQVLPDDWAGSLPAVDHSWGGFTDDLGVGEVAAPETESPETALGDDGYGRWHGLDADERSPLGQFTVMRETVARIDDRPSVNLVHVALPHYPWTLTPWGIRLTQFPHDMVGDPGDPAFPLATVQRYQLHALQVGAADVAVGEMIDHLQRVGAWDEALVVVTSDHGTSLLPRDLGRKITDENRERVLRVPLFVKAPGQQAGELRDDPAQTVDVLPSMLDLLGVEVDWELDGHSLYDGSVPRLERKISDGVEPLLATAARHAEDFAGDDWEGLAATGEHRALVGRPVADLAVGDASDLRWEADDERLFASLPTDDGRMPYLLSGAVRSADGTRPPDLLVAVNGTVAGVIGAYVEGDGGWRFTGFVGPWFVDGANTVDAYEVETTPLGPVLRPVGRI